MIWFSFNFLPVSEFIFHYLSLKLYLNYAYILNNLILYMIKGYSFIVSIWFCVFSFVLANAYCHHRKFQKQSFPDVLLDGVQTFVPG